jgi:small subunit ribosomal protein S17
MRNRGRVLEGVVSSAKMKKTIVVKVVRTKKHSLYIKSSKTFKKFKAHDEEQKAREGDVVRIVESRPYSKDKHFKLLEVVSRGEAGS